MKEVQKPLTMVFVHGVGHDGWFWQSLSRELRKPERIARRSEAGKPPVTVETPSLYLKDPRYTFTDHAQQIVDIIVARRKQQAEDVMLIGHSRAGNILPLVAGMTAVQQLVYIAGSFQDATIKPLMRRTAEAAPPKYHTDYATAVLETGDHSAFITDEQAVHYYYHDCEPAVAREATNHLHAQRLPTNATPISYWAEVPTTFMVCANDRVINPAWQRFVGRKLLGANVVELPTGHSAPLVNPPLVANHLEMLIA